MSPVESGADRVRRHVRVQYIDPARRDGRNTVTIRAGDVARELHLGNRVPAVCSALGSKLLLEQAGLRLVERRGPRQSTTTEFHFEFAGGRAETGTEEVQSNKRQFSAAALCGQRAARAHPASGIRGSTHALSGLVRQDEAHRSCGCEGSLCVAVVPESPGFRRGDRQSMAHPVG